MTNDIKIYSYKGGEKYVLENYVEFDGEELGVHIGQDLIGALLTPPALKENITNVSRTEHGTRVMEVPYLAERSVTLNFVIIGRSRNVHIGNLDAFMGILNNGHFALSLPKMGGASTYFLNYQSCQSYSITRTGRSSKLAVKCVEYRPDIRDWQ